MSQTPLLIAQLTDTHLFADPNRTMKGCPTAASLQTVLAHLQQQSPQPDLLLLTGDLSQDETRASYENLRDRITPLGLPAYWIPGNHDQSLADMKVVLDTDLISPDKSFQKGGWNFVLLNTMQPQLSSGALSSESLQWLDEQLQQSPNTPTLIALHHAPMPVGLAFMDAIALENPEALFAVTDRHPQVKLVVFGHIHQEFDQERNGVRYLGTPSTCIQLMPNQAEVRISNDYPGYRLLHLFPDGSYTTQVERVPFQFTEGNGDW